MDKLLTKQMNTSHYENKLLVCIQILGFLSRRDTNIPFECTSIAIIRLQLVTECRDIERSSSKFRIAKKKEKVRNKFE